MAVLNQKKYVMIAAALAASTAISGCSADERSGERLKRGFIASERAQTASFKIVAKMGLPSLTGETSTFSYTMTGDYDGGSDLNSTVDDSSRVAFETDQDGEQIRGELIELSGMEYTVVGERSIGGPAARDRTSESQWREFMDALAEHAEGFKSDGAKLVDGIDIDAFSGRLPKDAACGRLATLLEQITKDLDSESGEDMDLGSICNDMIEGDVQLGIGVDEKDWPRSISANAVVRGESLLGELDEEALPDEARELIEGQKGEVSIEMSVSQYDQPIKPIAAPSGARTFKSRAKYLEASDRLSG